METELSGGSVSSTDDTPQEFSFAKYLDTICPYYMNYGMTWDEFWYESIDRLQGYWQKHQRNGTSVQAERFDTHKEYQNPNGY